MRHIPTPHQAFRISKDNHYLMRSDGTPFFWLADTWWYGATKRMNPVALDALIADRKAKGFTVILIVIGAPPEISPLSSDAQNSGGCAFLSNGDLNPLYFDHADRVIHKLLEAGLTPCIVGSWGNHIDVFGVEPMKSLWREIITRWGTLPVIYCLTGEADIHVEMPAALPTTYTSKWKGFLKFIPIRNIAKRIYTMLFNPSSKKARALLKRRIDRWDEVAQFIKTEDKNRHLLTVHPQRKLLASELFNNPSWLDIDTIQSGHSKDNASFMITASIRGSKTKPFINLEPWYEGIFGNFGPQDQRYAFWACILSGACGHTYGAHGIWQMANNDNFMEHWGASHWKNALNNPGSAQLGAAKEFLTRYPWWTLKPDLTCIAPQWDESHPLRPVAAIDTTNRIWIYTPARGAHTEEIYTLRTPKLHTYSHLIQIDPKTMHIIKNSSFDEPFTFASHPDHDQLMLIE